jgi:HemY protein
MKSGLIIIFALAVGAFGAHFLLEDSGYVLINMRGYAIEMSVPGLILGLVLLYALVRLAIHLYRVPRQLGRAAGSFRNRRSTKRVTRGLIEIAEGNPARGERLLTRGARKSDLPLLNYIVAARAAQIQGADDRRDNWLQMARERQPEATTAIQLTQAELQIDSGQLDEALATLQALGESAPEQGQRLALLARAYRGLEDWEALRHLLPKLAKGRAMKRDDLEALQREVCHVLIHKAATDADREALQAVWGNTPKALKAETDMFAAYARAQARCGDHDTLEKTLRKALKTSWSSDVIALYGELETSKPAAQLAHIEAWLTRRGEDESLLKAAAQVCMRNQLWGKARSYLESSVALRPDAATYQIYGQLLEKMGESDAAAEAYRRGLETVTSPESIPALEGPGAESASGGKQD